MPKLPPPPRSAQNRSGWLSSVTFSVVAVGGHELDADQVVAPEAVLGHQPAQPAAERVAGNPGRRDRASGHGEAVYVRLAVELAPRHAALGAHACGLRVDVDPRHLRQVDHQSAVGDRSAGDVVAAAADGDLRAARPRERESVRDVRRPAAARDQTPAAGRSDRCGRAGRRRSHRLRAVAPFRRASR